MLNMKKFSQKTVLVTGATGLIGSNLIHALMKEQSITVIALVRSKEKACLCFEEFLEEERFILACQDITETLEFKQPIHYIFHAAGPIALDLIRNRPVDIILPNLVGTQNCLEFLKCQKEILSIQGQLVIFSSATVYGYSDKIHDVCEADTTSAGALHDIDTVYSESKRASEVMALAYKRQYGLDIRIARFSYVYGYSHFLPSAAFYEFLTDAVQGKDICIRNPQQYNRDNIHVSDAVSGILHIALQGSPGEIYNVSSNGDLGNYTSADKMAEAIKDVVNGLKGSRSAIDVVLPLEEIVYCQGIRMCNKKLKCLGWAVEKSLYDGVQATVLSQIARIADNSTK